jgi:DNA mismatch repair protein MutL
MARIKQLSPQEAQKIAAGEVVERPANVVKELVENALDAGASSIAIYINDAGKSLIRIVDNGCGMNEEDAHTCFKHHATSKITRVDDLPTLTTFGFRGEALSSISAVSNVTLITKESEAATGIKLVLNQGTVIAQEQVSCNAGTDISIADLFFNVPARKKFLKTHDTELRQITLLFQAFCLDYLSVHFKLFTQGNLQYNCPPTSDLQQRAAQLWDHTIAQQIMPLHAEKNGITIQGIISHHTYSRYDRSAIFFFVNRRWIKNHALSKALLKGYMNVLQPDKFPLGCINILLDPALVDINIHPRKEEVQFLNPRIAEQLLQTTVKENLEKHLSAQLNRKVSFSNQMSGSPHEFHSHSPRMAPLMSPSPHVFSAQRPRPFQESSTPFVPPLSIAFVQGSGEVSAETDSKGSSTALQLDIPQPISETQTNSTPHTEYQIIGQFHKTYILIEQEDSLFLVDQHAAHERILYELFSTRFDEVATIGLLFPQIITLNADEMQLLEAHLPIFTSNHIAVEIMGAQQLAVQAIPIHLKEMNIEELVRQTIGWIVEFNTIDAEAWYKKVNQKLHAQMACKAAVKAGDSLTMIQMQHLLAGLEKMENRFTCPHGRPTGWALPLYEIEKKFKRKL